MDMQPQIQPTLQGESVSEGTPPDDGGSTRGQRGLEQKVKERTARNGPTCYTRSYIREVMVGTYCPQIMD